MDTTAVRPIAPARRTAEIRYAVRDVIIEAERAARAGRDLIHLNIGDPNIFDFAPPAHIIDAVHRAMRDNRNGYAPSSGIPDALAAIRSEAERKGIRNIQHTYVTSGCSEAIELALAALADPGDNVLTPSPGYPLYTAVLAKLGVENRAYYLNEADDWQPDVDDIASRIDERTRAIVLINPNNPTGSVTGPETLARVIELAQRHNLVILSDEIYDKLVLEGRPHVSTASLDPQARVVTFNGLSKAYVVPGFRIGWGIVSGPAEELADYCEAIARMERARISANHPEQYAIRPALEGPQDHVADMNRRLLRRRDAMLETLRGIPGVSCVAPRGAFYAFPRLHGPTPDSEVVTQIIRETGVVLVPGSGFGQPPGTQHFRIVFLPPEATLREALTRVSGVLRAK